MRPLLALATAAVLAACGDGGSLDVTGPDDGEPEDSLPIGPAIVGDTIYALDASNRLLLFGSESADSVSAVLTIRGVPLFSRIIGIDVRPDDGRLYGVGNDSRVYVIDPSNGEAEPVSEQRFVPSIASFFDSHFAMAFEPSGDRIRLVSADTRANWSIDPDDGTARAGNSAHYADGDPNENRPPAISGIAFVPSASAGVPGPYGASQECDDLMLVFDADLSNIASVCDGDLMEIESLFEIPLAVTRCSEITYDSNGNLFAIMLDVIADVNRLGRINPDDGSIEWASEVPHDSPIQDITF